MGKQTATLRVVTAGAVLLLLLLMDVVSVSAVSSQSRSTSAGEEEMEMSPVDMNVATDAIANQLVLEAEAEAEVEEAGTESSDIETSTETEPITDASTASTAEAEAEAAAIAESQSQSQSQPFDYESLPFDGTLGLTDAESETFINVILGQSKLTDVIAQTEARFAQSHAQGKTATATVTRGFFGKLAAIAKKAVGAVKKVWAGGKQLVSKVGATANQIAQALGHKDASSMGKNLLHSLAAKLLTGGMAPTPLMPPPVPGRPPIPGPQGQMPLLPAGHPDALAVAMKSGNPEMIQRAIGMTPAQLMAQLAKEKGLQDAARAWYFKRELVRQRRRAERAEARRRRAALQAIMIAKIKAKEADKKARDAEYMRQSEWGGYKAANAPQPRVAGSPPPSYSLAAPDGDDHDNDSRGARGIHLSYGDKLKKRISRAGPIETDENGYSHHSTVEIEDCTCCLYIWKQVEMDLGGVDVEENVYDSFIRNTREAEKTPIFNQPAQQMFNFMSDMVGDYLDQYSAAAICENSLFCRFHKQSGAGRV